MEGEALLLKLLKLHKSERVRMAAASVLSYRLSDEPHHLDLEIILETDEYDSARVENYVPGQVCRYYGPMSSIILEENLQGAETNEAAVVEVSARDFLASLHRMLSLNNEFFIN